MASLAKHKSTQITKMILMGDSGTGKTGSLVSLVKAGYKLRILDMDNGVDTLYQFVMRECPDKAGNVDTVALRDPRKATPQGLMINGQPKAFVNALKLLDKWTYQDEDGATVDLGVPASWGADTILVVDSLSFLSDAAMDWAEPLVPSGPKGKDMRAVYGQAQKAIEDVIGLLTNPTFNCNVIVTAHIRLSTMPDGTTKGHPNSAGQALGPLLPRYFNSIALFETKPGGKRTLRTESTGLIDLKNPAPFRMSKEYPIETGLAEFFKTVRGE